MRYPKKNFRYLGPSMCFSKRINWIISEVQRQNFFLKVFSSSYKVLAALGSGSRTCSVFLHLFPFQGNVSTDIIWLLHEKEWGPRSGKGEFSCFKNKRMVMSVHQVIREVNYVLIWYKQRNLRQVPNLTFYQIIPMLN